MFKKKKNAPDYLVALASSYNSMHLVDLSLDTVVELSTNDGVREWVNEVNNAVSQMRAVMIHIVEDEYIREAIEFTDLTTISERLAGKNKISKELVSVNIGWFRASFIVAERDEEGKVIKVFFVTEAIDEAKRKEEGLIKASTTDELTGLLNRRTFDEDLRLYENNHPGRGFVFGLFDLNGLKVANDSLGHEAGDELIVGVSSVLRNVFSDYGKLYRIGGDEFVALFNADETLFGELTSKFDKELSEWRGKFSKGISVASGYARKVKHPDVPVIELERIAEKYMYEAKQLHYISSKDEKKTTQVAYDTICNSFAKIMRVNLANAEYSLIKTDSVYAPDTLERNETYSDIVQSFGRSSLIREKDRENFLICTDTEYLANVFKRTKEPFCVKYECLIDNQYVPRMMEFIPVANYSESNQTIYVYVQTIGRFAETK